MDEINEKIKAGLLALANDLYGAGYQAGLGETDLWLESYAEAMYRVALGEPYDDKMVIEIFLGKKRVG